CRRAGIPLIGWHDMRRTFATWSNPTGESLKALQTQLGHTDSRLTLGIYTQPMPEAQRQLAAKVERVLLPVAPKFGTAGNGSEGVIQRSIRGKTGAPGEIRTPDLLLRSYSWPIYTG